MSYLFSLICIDDDDWWLMMIFIKLMKNLLVKMNFDYENMKMLLFSKWRLTILIRDKWMKNAQNASNTLFILRFWWMMNNSTNLFWHRWLTYIFNSKHDPICQNAIQNAVLSHAQYIRVCIYTALNSIQRQRNASFKFYFFT